MPDRDAPSTEVNKIIKLQLV